MWRKAINGNVSAARYIREEFGKGPAKAAANRVRQREVKEAPMGKKAERQAAAERVGGVYATPAPPTAKLQ
ncbi:hypothetical protein D3C72_317830 [compost metagenome]